MKTDFQCPDCKGYLNIGDDLIFSVKGKKWPGGLLLLNPELGNYSFRAHPSFTFEMGELFDFYCPICLKHLASEEHDHLARIMMLDESGTKYEVYFSRVAGEKSTFSVVGDNVEYYGPDSGKYVDFINLTQIS